jgi:hypothetical protein
MPMKEVMSKGRCAAQSTKVHFETVEKSLLKQEFGLPAMPGFKKSILFTF